MLYPELHLRSRCVPERGVNKKKAQIKNNIPIKPKKEKNK
jgi:hypothetical protein